MRSLGVTMMDTSATHATALLLAVALIVSSPGFYRVLYFISIGYGYAVAMIAVAIFVMFSGWHSAATTTQLTLLLIYGLRLGTFILLRERKAPKYRDLIGPVMNPPLVARAGIWIAVSLLYVAMTSPAWLVAAAESVKLAGWWGIALMACGLFLEAEADREKSAFKRRQPDRFCDVGLYRFIRQPNYFGEILFWTGNFLAGLPYFGLAWQWLLAGAGLLLIVLIMLGEGRRLEESQEQRYGAIEEFGIYPARADFNSPGSDLLAQTPSPTPWLTD